MYTILANEGKFVQNITNLEQIKAHENYVDDGLFKDDIAIIKLNEAVKIPTASLPKAGFSMKSDYQKVSAIGWGRTSVGKFFFQFSKFNYQVSQLVYRFR